MNAREHIEPAAFMAMVHEPVKVIVIRDGYDFSNHEHTTREQAKRWIDCLKLIKIFEVKHGYRDVPYSGLLIINFDHKKPEWPVYLDKDSLNILHAWYKWKFGF